MSPAKPKPVKPKPNIHYRNYIESLGCLCKDEKECYQKTVCHHLNTGGMGTSGHDEFNTIPLCMGTHHTTGIHTTTEALFEQNHNLPHLRSLAVVFGVSYFGAEQGKEKLAKTRGISIEQAERIILTAIANIENGKREWVG